MSRPVIRLEGADVIDSIVRIIPLRDGAMIACDDGASARELVEAVRAAVVERPEAFAGPTVVIDIGRRPMTLDEVVPLEETLLELLGPKVVQIVQGEDAVDILGEEAAEPGVAAAAPEADRAQERRAADPPAGEPRGPGRVPRASGAAPGGNAYLIRRTVRSGQRVTCDGNLVVLGDVNPGAELIASGDILVLGSLRGVAHAGARGHEGAVIAALRLQPVQLRIGPYISRPPDAPRSRPERLQPERAVVRDGAIVVEPLPSRRVG